MKSIMHQKDGTCYLCMKLEGNYFKVAAVQEHHVVFGGFGSGRKLSEKYGLKVYLCVRHHLHDGGPDAVHRSAKTRKLLCEEAQRCFEKTYPKLSFLEIFGKNWILEEEKHDETEEKGIDGFIPIQTGGLNDGNVEW